MHCQVTDRPFWRREQANLALKERACRAFAGGTASPREDCMNMNEHELCRVIAVLTDGRGLSCLDCRQACAGGRDELSVVIDRGVPGG